MASPIHSSPIQRSGSFEGVSDSSSVESKFNNVEGDIRTSAEHVDGFVEGGKSISRSNSNDSVVFLTGHEDVEFTGAGLKDGEEFYYIQRGSQDRELPVLDEAAEADAKPSSNRPLQRQDSSSEDDLSLKSFGSQSEEVEEEAAAKASSKPPSTFIREKQGVEKKGRWSTIAEQVSGVVTSLVGKSKGISKSAEVPIGEQEARAAVKQYIDEFKDNMFNKDKLPDAFRAYLGLHGFDIKTYENPGKDHAEFKVYITQLILDENIKKSELSPKKLNKVLTDLINKKVEAQDKMRRLGSAEVDLNRVAVVEDDFRDANKPKTDDQKK